MQDFHYLTAFVMGLMGGVHCVAMCGGIVGALSFGVKQPENHRGRPLFLLISGYNFGRLFSYTLIGGLMGSVGWMASHWFEIRQMQTVLQFTAALFMLLLGLYLSGWWPVLVYLEKMGAPVWKKIEPLGKKLLPVTNLRQAVGLGMIWGWLPCGLVYSVLIWSVSAGSFQRGALLMLCFGLGTLPNLLAMGLVAQRLNHWVRNSYVRQVAGVMVMLFGGWSFYLVYVSVFSDAVG